MNEGLNIAVFCGARMGKGDHYQQLAKNVGAYLANHNIGLVYGGGRMGLMGAVADGALDAGGKVVGVIPQFLREKEVAHAGVTELIITQTMHERKAIMSDMSDAFIVIPGGFGTMDEMVEIITWNQLKIVEKPIGILNVGGFYNALLAHIAHCIEEGFIDQADISNMVTDESLDSLLEKLLAFMSNQKN